MYGTTNPCVPASLLCDISCEPSPYVQVTLLHGVKILLCLLCQYKPPAISVFLRFPGVISAASRMSYFPTGAGGMLSHVVAAAAAALKVEEGTGRHKETPDSGSSGLAAQLTKVSEWV